MLHVRLEPTLERVLETAARERGRSKSDLVREALRAYLLDAHSLAAAQEQSRACAIAEGEDDGLLDALAQIEGWEWPEQYDPVCQDAAR